MIKWHYGTSGQRRCRSDRLVRLLSIVLAAVGVYDASESVLVRWPTGKLRTQPLGASGSLMRPV